MFRTIATPNRQLFGDFGKIRTPEKSNSNLFAESAQGINYLLRCRLRENVNVARPQLMNLLT